MEKKTQQRLTKFLRSKGFYVIKTRPGPGTPVGCPDVIALNEGLWVAFEVKASAKASFRPLQKETVKKFKDWSFCWVVYPENIDEVIEELKKML